MHLDQFSQRGLAEVSRQFKILVVDEESGDLRVIRLILEGQGFEVLSCSSVDLGLQYLDQVHFDFVIVSQGSPAFEGRTLVKRATAQNVHRPTLVLTRCYNMECYLEAMQLGAIDYLEKPIRPMDLVQIVRVQVSLSGLRSRQAQS